MSGNVIDRFFRVRVRQGFSVYKILGIPVWRSKTLESSALGVLHGRRTFNAQDLDRAVAQYVDEHVKVGERCDAPGAGVAFLATELYDTGGHTECVKNLACLLSESYPLRIFLTRYDEAQRLAPKKIGEIREFSSIEGIDYRGYSFKRKLVDLYGKIIAFAPRVLFVFMHMDDVLGAALLSLLKKNTSIRIVYFNHGSHFPALGFSMSDLVLEGMPSTHYVTKHFRGVDRCHVVGLPSAMRGETRFISDDERSLIRKGWGADSGSLVSMTGCNSAKLFEGQDSPYFEMVKRLLAKEKRLIHVVVSSLSSDQRRIIERIFYGAPELSGRLVFERFRHDFDVFFQSCDVFIDSFPVSSALTYLDLMRNRVAFVAKINSENSLYSFHEYLDASYPFMHEEVEDVENSVLMLLRDEGKRASSVQANHQFYMRTYGKDATRKRYAEIIDNADSLDRLYDVAPDGSRYRFGEI